MRATPRRLVVSAALAGSFCAWPALGGDAQTAEALYQSAREALARGELDKACPEFAESQRLDPAPGTLLNLGECEERSGKLAAALAHVQEGHDQLPPGDYRVPFALEKIAKLKRRVPRLVLRVKTPAAGMTVLRDETELGPASLAVPLPVDPGAHVCTLRVPGHADSRVGVTLDESETKVVELVAGPAVASTGAERGGAAGSAQRTWAYVAGGAGLAALVVGGVLGVTSKLEYDTALSGCPHGASSCSGPSVTEGRSAYTQATAADVGFIAGGALLATGIVLYLTAPKRESVALTPAVGQGAAGIRLRGAW